METDVVQSVGQRIVGLELQATSAVNGVLTSYADASGVVHHPVVRAAMSAYHDTHQKGHLAFVKAVGSLGAGITNVGRAIADGNNEAAAVQRGSLGAQQMLARDFDSPL